MMSQIVQQDLKTFWMVKTKVKLQFDPIERDLSKRISSHRYKSPQSVQNFGAGDGHLE